MFRRALTAAIDQADLETLIRSLLARGQAGDTKAAALVLGYLVGKPVQPVEQSGPDGGPIQVRTLTVRMADAEPLEAEE